MSLFKEKLELKVEEAELATQYALKGFPPVLKWILILGLLGSIPAYFVAKKLSYAYWQNKLKALEIQGKPSFDSALDLQISPALLISYPDGSFGAMVEVTNPNLELSSRQMTYSWQYLNSSGQVILPLNSDAEKGSAYILPSSKKVLVAPKINASEPIAQAEFLPDKVNWQKKLKLPKVLLTVTPASAHQQTAPLNFSVESSVLNNSPYQIKQVRLAFVVKDESGQPVAVSQRTESDIKPYERRAFKQLWPGLWLDNPRVEITADTNLLDPQNLILSEQAGSSSDLSRPEQENSRGF